MPPSGLCLVGWMRMKFSFNPGPVPQEYSEHNRMVKARGWGLG